MSDESLDDVTLRDIVILGTVAFFILAHYVARKSMDWLTGR